MADLEKKSHNSEKKIKILFEMVKNLSDEKRCDEEKKKKARVKPTDTAEVISFYFFIKFIM